MRNLFLFLMLILICTLRLSQAQSFPQKPLSQIIIVGNDRTHSEVIERELLFSVGEVLNDSIIVESKKRLLNLWLFNRVEFYPLPDGNYTGLLISVTERLYIFPYPEFKMEDRDWKKLTYGFGIAHENFRGRNEKIYLSFLFGNRPGFGFSYANPWVNRQLHLTTSFFIKKYHTKSYEKITIDNETFSINEEHLFTSFSIGKYWTRYLYSGLRFSRDGIQVNEMYKAYLPTQNQKESLYAILFNTLYDTRDLFVYPERGWFIRLSVGKSGFFVPEIDYWKYGIDLRRYVSWQQFTLAGRVAVKQSYGILPFYDRIYLGFEERVRGHFYKVVSGKHVLVNQLELRFPIFDIYYFDFPIMGLPPSSTKDLKFGLKGGFFVETGVVWNKPPELAINNFITGFGAGIHIIIPYFEVLRIDLAFDEKLKTETIFEIGLAF